MNFGAAPLPRGLCLLAMFLPGCAVNMPGKSHQGPLPELTAEEAALRDGLRRQVEALAGRIGERNVGRPEALEAAAKHIEAELRAIGLQPSPDEYEAAGRKVRNIVAEIAGAGGDPGEILLLGAHYDSVPGSPGANDNGSGVAALLEVARLLEDSRPARTIRFVAFVNEEPPHFQTDAMGSLVHARRARERGDRIAAMISIETIGCFLDAPDSQSYPFPFSLFYPSTGNFIAFVANPSSKELLNRTVSSFRSHTAFPSEGAAVPGWITGVGWSDHWSFWEAGYPAIMITDTAPFRYPFYHAAGDTPDRLDYARMARVTAGIARVARELAGE